jgi:D-tagatose-1,6-bisphosphate aldolase subunit GatZ/KbaZ
LTPTSAEAARATLAAHREAFSSAGVGEAFDRVVALVVQPGVEFDARHVVDYDRERTAWLRQVVDDPDALDDGARATPPTTRPSPGSPSSWKTAGRC